MGTLLLWGEVILGVLVRSNEKNCRSCLSAARL